MFFARCVVSVARFLPKQGKFPYYFRLMFNYSDCEKKVIAWHRTELEKLDFKFRLQQASFRLVAAREKAIEKGISPSDPGYPDLDLDKLFDSTRNEEGPLLIGRIKF